MSPFIILLITWISFFLLHDQIYPGQVSGQDADVNTVTLSVCPAPSQFEDHTKTELTQYVCWYEVKKPSPI